MTSDPLRRVQLWGGVLLLAGSVFALAYAALVSSASPFVAPGGRGLWITYPLATYTDAIGVDLENVPTYGFERSFTLARVPEEVRLRGKALREARVLLNGAEVPIETGRSWKSGFTADVARWLEPGRNQLEVRVRHGRGPALLQLSLTGEGVDVVTDTRWEVTRAGGRADAVLAEDRRLHPEALALPTPGALFAHHFLLVAGLFAVFAGLHAVTRGRLGQHAPAVALGLATLYWCVLFVAKFAQLPVMMGFDIPAHLQYIDFLLAEGRLPLATDGWSAYHPPVFYLLTSGLVALTGVARESGAGQVVYRLVPFLAGLANVWITWAVTRRLFPREPGIVAFAIAAAALLPMNVYMSAYVSNEQLHGAWVSLALLGACAVLTRPETPPLRLAWVAAALGLAILTKFTSLLVVPVVVVCVAAKPWLVGRHSPARSVAIAGALLAGIAAIGGWFYLRNWIHFGAPVVGNWNVPGAITWWEQPGFHTLSYYTGFGESLRHPFFAGYASFWDGVYSTAWGDGLAAGMVSLGTRHAAWNYDFMTLGYGLALPMLCVITVGFVQTARRALSGADLGQRIALSMMLAVLYTVSFALLRVTVSLPYYAQAKAFYAIATVVPLALVTGVGVTAIAEWLEAPRYRIARALYFGWLGTLATVFVLAFLG